MSNAADQLGADAGPELELELRRLTEWTGPVPHPAVWRVAAEVAGLEIGPGLEGAAGGAGGTRRHRLRGWLGRGGRGGASGRLRMAGWVASWVAVFAVVVGVAIVATTPGPGARQSSRALPMGAYSRYDGEAPAALERSAPPASPAPPAPPQPPATIARASGEWLGSLDSAAPASPGVGAGVPEADVGRQVIRKATLDLLTPDVRAAFMKASFLVSEAGGEYVQESALTGTGRYVSGTLSLRVTATRMSVVMGQLRELGVVASESASGEDVTAQVVDIEARLRNERRVEVELLELLSSRSNAPLKEVLELRDSIARVRQTIESLGAQQQRLSRLVSLATILVSIRAEAEGPRPVGMLGERLEQAWNTGRTSFVGSVGWLVEVLVGGAVWWALLAAGAVCVLVARRRAIARFSVPPALDAVTRPGA